MSPLGSFGLPGHIDVAVLLIIAYPIARALYNVYFHPLSHFPGPTSWAASRLPYIRSLLRGTIVHDTEKSHRIHGPIVRVAPNELSFAHENAWTDIFQGRSGHPQYLKDPVWWAKQPGQPDSLISAIDPGIHGRMRKLLSNGFTPRALRQQEPIVQKYVGLLIERLRELTVAGGTEGAVLDIVPWFNFTTFDIFGDLGFAESFECLQHARYHPWIALLFNSVKAATFVISARFYPLIEFILMRCIPKSLKKMQRDHFQQIVDKVQRRMNWEVDRPDLMSYVIKNNDGEGMSLGEIQATFMVLTTAGSETTATALSGTLNYLMANPDKLFKLTQEIRGRFEGEADITLDALSELPFLNAALQEGLRLCPPVPIMLPRVVPEGGDIVCGMFIPGGTSVSLQAWSLFRDPARFYHASSYLPERWLLEAQKQKESPFYNDHRDAVQAFSVGPRSCMGRHLAWAEMRLVLARLLWAFDVEAAGEEVKWEELRTFLLVEKRAIEVNVKERKN